jgi:hypothetical protein
MKKKSISRKDRATIRKSRIVPNKEKIKKDFKQQKYMPTAMGIGVG